jgi:hypothetical protein
MKSKFWIIALVVLVGLLAFPAAVFAAGPHTTIPGDKVVFGGTYTLNSGDTLGGNLAVFGGSATVEKDAKVNGDVLLAGGSLNINGEVGGNVSAMGGSLSLGDNAVVHGNVAILGAALNRSSKAVVNGKIINGLEGPLNLTVPSQGIQPGINVNLKPITEVFWFIFRTLGIAALAMLLALFIPNPIQRAARVLTTDPLPAGAVGLLTVIIAPILIVILTITIILIPISLLAILLLVIAWVFGWIVIGTEVGVRLAGMARSNWALPVSAGVGTLILSLVLGIIGYIPCIGWIPGALVGMLGLGIVILTRFGLYPYPQARTYYPPSSYQTYQPVPPVPPAPPQPPIPPVPTEPAPPPAPSESSEPPSQG